MTDSELCDHFNISIYQVKDLPEGYAPSVDPEQYMVTVMMGHFPSATIAAIPLSDTQEAAGAAAVEYLNLRERYDQAKASSKALTLAGTA